MELRSDLIDGVRIAAIIDQNNVIALYARPDDERLWVGDILTAKIMRYASAQKAYFASTDNTDILLPHKSSTAFKPGDTVTIKIERPATHDKNPRAILSDEKPQKGPDITTTAQRDFPDAVIHPDTLEDFDTAIALLQEARVPMPNGISLAIDEAIALTAIDVNAAAPDLSPLEVNERAATEIFRQFNLRNLQGQIVIDFLRLRDPEQKARFQTHLDGLVATHNRPVTLYGFTRMGLFELTREKRGLSLNNVFSLARK